MPEVRTGGLRAKRRARAFAAFAVSSVPILADAALRATAEVLSEDTFRIMWDGGEIDGACKVWVYESVMEGGMQGSTAWREEFSQAQARSGSVPAIASGTMEGYVDAADGLRQWELDHVYPAVDDGAIRIGGTKTNGWLRTPPLPEVHGGLLKVRARRQNTTDGRNMPVKVARATGELEDVGRLGIADDYADYELALPEIGAGDRLELRSTDDRRSCRVLVDSLEVLAGHYEGEKRMRFVVDGAEAEGGEYEFRGEAGGEYGFFVEDAAGDVSETGRVDLAYWTSAARPRFVKIDRELEHEEDFNALSNRIGSVKAVKWANLAEPLPGWFAFSDGEAETNLAYNAGQTQVGMFAAWYDLADQTDGWALGSYTSSHRTRTFGVVFSNSLGRVVQTAAVSFRALQLGKRNSQPDTLGFGYRVTGEVADIGAEDGWTEVEEMSFTSPLTTADEAACPVEQAKEGELEVKVPANRLLMFRWRDDCPASGANAALGIDDLRVVFRLEEMPTAVRIQ